MRNKTSAEYRETTQGVKQGCPLSAILFNLYIDEVTTEWQKELKTHYIIDAISLNTLLFADDQVVLADSEDNLQRAVYKLIE
jgi:retron-type reverse transcriptase